MHKTTQFFIATEGGLFMGPSVTKPIKVGEIFKAIVVSPHDLFNSHYVVALKDKDVHFYTSKTNMTKGMRAINTEMLELLYG